MRGRLCLLLAVVSLPAAAEHRWALLVGENHGLVGEEPLRFAQADARMMGAVLGELGGVEPDRATYLLGANAQQLRAALSALSARMAKEASPEDRLYVYVSSHAAEQALHLDGSELPVSELVGFVQRAPVGLGLLIIDACRSGGMTRTKGLKRVSPTEVRVDVGSLQGRVLISAAGPDEYAQESELLGGSYFTHYWVTGLRGAADASRDGRVTLEEAYAWAYARTLESTFASQGGAQRPNFRFDLRGQGQLVLTELARAGGKLVLEAGPPGHWLVVSAKTGAVAAEVEKPEGPLALALPAGVYRVRVRDDDGWLEREVELPRTGEVRVAGGQGELASWARVARKGAADVQWVVSAGAAGATGLLAGVGARPGLALGLRRTGELWGPLDELTLALEGRDGQATAPLDFRQSELELRVGGAHRFVTGRLALALGVELGAVLVHQSELPDATSRTGLSPLVQVSSGLRSVLVGPVELFLQLAGGVAAVKTRAGVGAVPRASGTLGLAVRL